MTRTTLPALAGVCLLCAGVVGVAAEPAAKPRPGSRITTGAAAGLAPAGDAARTRPVSRPRGATYISDLFPALGPVGRSAPPAPPKLGSSYELVVLAHHRPIRVRVELRQDGKSLDDRWADALRKAFDGVDRDRDGVLNGFEAQFVLSDAVIAALMQNGTFNPVPSTPPTLDVLDTDGDRQVSFAEFAAYYKLAAFRAARPFPPVAENPAGAQATEALYKLCDRNGDGKLTRDEVGSVEHLLATKDADEDECLSLVELTGDPYADPRFAGRVVRLGGGTEPVPARPENVSLFEGGKVPGTITQRVIKQYDRDGDFDLTAAEVGFDRDTFARLDTDGDGKLSGEELDVWRTGPPDLAVALSLAEKSAGCRVEITTDPKVAAARGFTASPVSDGRLMVRHGRQPIELVAFAPAGRGRRGQAGDSLKQLYLPLFQQAAGGKGYVAEADLGGANAPQYQVLRVLFDPADSDADGKLTREELNRYLDVPQVFADVAVSLTPAVQTPTLFQLLDENRDGRLGVRELRTAWDRLAALEPAAAGGRAAVVTRAAIQPAVSVRLTRTLERFVPTQQVFAEDPQNVAVPQKGPAWFRKMDRNADGDVSRGEFLGTRAEFDAIDADHDGLISQTEAEAHDAATRPAGEVK